MMDHPTSERLSTTCAGLGSEGQVATLARPLLDPVVDMGTVGALLVRPGAPPPRRCLYAGSRHRGCGHPGEVFQNVQASAVQPTTRFPHRFHIEKSDAGRVPRPATSP